MPTPERDILSILAKRLGELAPLAEEFQLLSMTKAMIMESV
jgi:hypothetical protein